MPTALAVRAAAQGKGETRVAWVSMDQAGSDPPVFAAFRAGMAELGYVAGKNLVIDAWWADGSVERLEKLRADILLAQPEVIVVQGGVALGPMLHPTVNHPVVFSMSADPVEAKIVRAPFAQRGNLLAYGPEFADVYRRLATYVDRIHKGARSGDLPVEQPRKFELVINLKTARPLGITVSQTLLVRADEVIE